MKKILFLLPFLMLASSLSMGQDIKHVSFDFSMDDFKVQKDITGNNYVLSDTYDYFLQSDTLLPALPYIGYNVLISSTEQYDSHVHSDSKVLFHSNISLAQNPEVMPTNMLPSTNGIKSVVSYSQRIYPTDFVEFVGMNDCDGYRILSFHVCPFEYDATAKKLFLRTHIDLDIHLRPSQSVLQIRTGNREAVRNTIRQVVVNPEDLEEQHLSIGDRSNNNLTQQTGFEYVIVTSNQFKSTFQELANWKSRKGIRSKVLTVENIVPAYTGSTTKEKIKRALADIDGLSYVLLGGDTLNVPTCMCYIGTSGTTDSITPADVYYSCLGKMNWDTNGNGLYGEEYDYVSLIPTLNVSRAPVSTVEDAQVFVNRIINYESAPDTTSWKNDVLMCGTSLGAVVNGHWQPYYENGQSDTQIWSQMIYNQCIATSWAGLPTRFYDTYTDISGDGSYDFIPVNLQNELAKGYTFVDVMTHGSRNSWRLENGYNYTNSQAKNLVNSGYSVITTTACKTNAFDYHTSSFRCLSQKFFNNPQSGILAYCGTSRENWYSPYNLTSLGVGARFDTLTYSKLFNDKYHRIGKAITAVKIAKMSEAIVLWSNYSTTRKIWMGLNLMGDPEMPIYLSKPKFFQNVSIQFINDSIYIDAGTDGFDICFINQNGSTGYYIARDITDSVAVFSRINGIFDVCITRPGYVPYTTTYGDIYLQNKTLAGTKTYETGNAMIGSDVTNKIAQGPVVVNSGNVTVKASRRTTITKDFKVKSGAKIAITNE